MAFGRFIHGLGYISFDLKRTCDGLTIYYDFGLI